MSRPKTPHVKLTLRVPPETHDRLVEVAASSNRSLNAEIVTLLQLALEGWKR